VISSRPTEVYFIDTDNPKIHMVVFPTQTNRQEGALPSSPKNSPQARPSCCTVLVLRRPGCNARSVSSSNPSPVKEGIEPLQLRHVLQQTRKASAQSGTFQVDDSLNGQVRDGSIRVNGWQEL
jgi:hypothetical protein